MKKIVLFIFVLVFNLQAADVSSFDIKGIKLGMTEKELLNFKNINCELRWKNYIESSNILSDAFYTCKGQNYYIDISINQQQKVTHIYMHHKFIAEPHWDTIENKFYTKYGNTLFSKKYNSYAPNGDHYVGKYLCWGDCKNDSSGYKIKRNGKGLHIQISKITPSKPSIDMILSDEKTIIHDENWREEEEQKWKKRKKEEDSQKATMSFDL